MTALFMVTYLSPYRGLLQANMCFHFLREALSPRRSFYLRGWMMDNIERLLQRIKSDNAIWKMRDGREIRFSGKFLDTVGEIFERHGFGTAKIYLKNQVGRERTEAISLLKVMDMLESCP